MPLSNALFSGVTGLDSTSTAISVIGDNIANVNTPGFKERRAEFADVLGQTISSVNGFSQIGAGSKTMRISQIFSQGTFETTSRPTDLAIEGKGFFILDGSQGRFYSRAGIFTFDRDGYLVNPQELRVQGYGIDTATGLSNGQLGDIQLPSTTAPPSPTSSLEMSVNLDSTSPNTGPFSTVTPAQTSNFQSAVTVYDSLGTAHPMTIFFTRTGGAWSWNATVPATSTTTAPVAGASIVSMGSGAITFDSNGLLTAPAAPVNVNFTPSGGATSPQAIQLDFGPVAGGTAPVETTQFDADSTVNSFSQDGFASGTLQSVVVGRDGYITGLFSNGETINLAQVALASFPNVEGLVSVGDNNLVESRISGQALVGGPQTGSFGSVRASSLEQSNVDLAAQFVRLIINQRAFQANTRTIGVTNELLANLVNLGQ
jgi:flagellar hook protein FlgE